MIGLKISFFEFDAMGIPDNDVQLSIDSLELRLYVVLLKHNLLMSFIMLNEHKHHDWFHVLVKINHP